jgi:Protein of unknown function DUF262
VGGGCQLPSPPRVRCPQLRLSRMPEQRYEAGRKTIGTLLATTSPRIEVPEWQRSYSWTTEEIEAFWQDLVAFDAQYPEDNIIGEEYFLGSIVLVTGGATNLLLDGQQRLATATILLSVLRDARRQYSGDAAARLQSKYISDFDDATQTTTHVLTLNVYDQDFFRAEIQDEPKTPLVRPTPTLRSHGRSGFSGACTRNHGRAKPSCEDGGLRGASCRDRRDHRVPAHVRRPRLPALGGGRRPRSL